MPGWIRSGKLKLIAQCKAHADLLQRHFGLKDDVVIVPLDVPDISIPAIPAIRTKRGRSLAVYHGACNHAKGIAHVISLARLMPDWDFLIPASMHEFNKDFGHLDHYPANLIFKQMSWASGLSDYVRSADIVLCPSSWSAPIEGAVLKSLAHNGLVGLYIHETSFAAEIPEKAKVSIDPHDLDATVARLRRLISHPDEADAIRVEARSYIQTYEAKSRFMLRAIRRICSSPAQSA
jgi:hypothetical protein